MESQQENANHVENIVVHVMITSQFAMNATTIMDSSLLMEFQLAVVLRVQTTA